MTRRTEIIEGRTSANDYDTPDISDREVDDLIIKNSALGWDLESFTGYTRQMGYTYQKYVEFNFVHDTSTPKDYALRQLSLRISLNTWRDRYKTTEKREENERKIREKWEHEKPELERKEREIKELERKKREELERKEREHQEWLATEEGQRWQAEEKRKQEERDEEQRRLQEEERKKRALAERSRNRKVLLLCFFLGFLGVHRFYVGKKGTGFLFLITFGFMGIGVTVDMVRIAYGKFDSSVSKSSMGGKILCWISVIMIIIFYISVIFR